MERLDRRFTASPGELRAVARAAGDLSDAGRYERDAGVALTPELVVSELEDAPDDHDLAQRWNWWVGSLDLAYGDYERFSVRYWDEQ